MRLKVNDQYEEGFLINKDKVDLFANLTGDRNPIHIDQDFASKTPFGKCIVHGILSAGFISRVIANKLPGSGTIYLSQSLNFKSPIFVGDELIVHVRVMELRDDKPVATLETICYSNGNIVIEGEAKVKYQP
ncbi:MAG: MaoC family dehydratase [Ekhidna sp.]|nr:MaoC family dehydratase [Ekhidna sp.]